MKNSPAPCALSSHDSGEMSSWQRSNILAYRNDLAIEQWSSVYKLFPAERRLFLKYYRTSERVLDLACGAGRTTLKLHEMGFNVKGIDTSEPLISLASRRFPYIKFEVGSFTSIPEPSQSWDHVLISFNGIDLAHPEDSRIQALRECYRVLRKGGTLIFSSHNIKAFHASPYYLNREYLVAKLRNTWNAFKEHAYLLDRKQFMFFGSPRYVVSQTREQGFEFLEMEGFRASGDSVFNKYCSPYIHYAFRRSE